VVLRLTGDGFTATGSVNRVSGSTDERPDVGGGDSRRQVFNLAEVVDHKGRPAVRRRGDRVPVARQHSSAAARHRADHPRLPRRGTDRPSAGRPRRAAHPRDALPTHELCERIVTEARARAA
jgi:virulence factor